MHRHHGGQRFRVGSALRAAVGRLAIKANHQRGEQAIIGSDGGSQFQLVEPAKFMGGAGEEARFDRHHREFMSLAAARGKQGVCGNQADLVRANLLGVGLAGKTHFDLRRCVEHHHDDVVQMVDIVRDNLRDAMMLQSESFPRHAGAGNNRFIRHSDAGFPGRCIHQQLSIFNHHANS